MGNGMLELQHISRAEDGPGARIDIGTEMDEKKDHEEDTTEQPTQARAHVSRSLQPEEKPRSGLSDTGTATAASTQEPAEVEQC